MKLKNGETILFTGDSITDCGRRDPQHAPLGHGYVKMFSDMLTVREPKKNVKVINTGISGHTVEDLRDRWCDDVLAHKPDWLSIKIGINDCHRYLSDKNTRPLQSPEEYAKIYNQILALTKKKLPKTKIMLIAPFYASRDNTPGSYRKKVYTEVKKYIATTHKLSKKYKTRLVKTQEIFDKQFKSQHASIYFPNEPVHPNSAGHMLIAESVYKTLSK